MAIFLDVSGELYAIVLVDFKLPFLAYVVFFESVLFDEVLELGFEGDFGVVGGAADGDELGRGRWRRRRPSGVRSPW